MSLLTTLFRLKQSGAFVLSNAGRQRVMRFTRMSLSSTSAELHKKFLAENAKISVPKRINTLFEILSIQGLEVVSPLQRKGLNPLLIPLAKNNTDGSILCYLRWPTQKENMDIQIVRTNEVGVTLVSMSTDHYCHRQAMEMDFLGSPHAANVADLLNQDGQLYNVGDYLNFFMSGKFPVLTADDQRLALDRYLLTRVGTFPDCFERLSENFAAQKNEISALVTCERAVSVFYGWAFPMRLHSRMLTRLGRDKEAKDTARAALAMPIWTLASSRKELEEITIDAGFSGSKIVGDMHAFRAADPRTKDIEENGVSPVQVTRLLSSDNAPCISSW
jgi:hypothetical protein